MSVLNFDNFIRTLDPYVSVQTGSREPNTQIFDKFIFHLWWLKSRKYVQKRQLQLNVHRLISGISFIFLNGEANFKPQFS